jgi:hypothetical protein
MAETLSPRADERPPHNGRRHINVKNVGEKGHTIDRIEVAEFESHAEVKAWISKHAPAFLE